MFQERGIIKYASEMRVENSSSEIGREVLSKRHLEMWS